jgi:hypothetical protein
MKNPFSPPYRALFICSNATEWRRRPYWVNNVSIVVSIVISKFIHCTTLVTISGKSFFQQNFNLKSNVAWILDVVGCSFSL